MLKRKLHTLMLNAVRCCAPCVYACTLRTCSKLAKNRQRILFLIFREIWRVKNDKYRLGKKYANAERSHRFHSAEMFSRRFHSAEIYSHRFHRFTQIVRVRSVSHRIHRIHRSMVQKNPTDFTLLRCSPTDFTDLHRLSGCVVSPTEFTEFTEFTEVWCKKIPQISQSTQKS